MMRLPLLRASANGLLLLLALLCVPCARAQYETQITSSYFYAQGFGTCIDSYEDVLMICGSDTFRSPPSHMFVNLYSRIGNNWVLQTALAPESDVDNPTFSSSDIRNNHTALSDRFAVLGTDEVDYPAPAIGAVYIFERSDASDPTWSAPVRLELNDPVPYIRFGLGIALDGDWLFVGSARGVYVFRHDDLDGWEQTQLLSIPVPVTTGTFARDGHFLRARDGRLVIGALSTHVYGLNEGTWVQEAVIPRAGRSIAFRDSILVIGDDGDGGARGAYIYEETGGTWVQRFGLATPQSNSAPTVELSGDTVFVSAPDLFHFYRRGAGGTWSEVLQLPAAVMPGRAMAVNGERLFLSNGSGVRVYRLGASVPAEPGAGGAAVASLTGPTPNPVTTDGALRLVVPSPQHVTVTLYDLLGRSVGVLYDGALAAGPQGVPVSAAGLPPGVYIARARGETFEVGQRLTVAR